MTNRELFLQTGYVHVPRAEAQTDWSGLEQAYQQLAQQAEAKLLADPEAEAACQASGLIVVPEASDPQKLCRIEYLAGASTYIREVWVPHLAGLIEGVLGEAVLLFKDKCNLKHPGGGGFPAHQDITAYRHFDTAYHVTAAVMLDHAVALNGALEMASHWDALANGAEIQSTPRGPLGCLPSYTGGKRNGDIVDELAAEMQWQLLEAAPGDVVLFDSYVPHRSQPNRSANTRRILFFTFNLASEGERYAGYYRAKRETPDNPIFHVSTPTRHSALD